MKPKFITSPEANRRIAELEALVEKGNPITNAAPDPAKAKAAVEARLAAGKAMLAAAEAKAHAKLTAAALQPATVTAAAYLASVAKPGMSRAEFEKLSHPQRNEFIRSGGKLI